MILSQEVMFRQKALSILRNNDMKFPYFPWICFEKELQKCMEHGTVYNLATVKEWVKLKRRRFENHGNSDWQLYGYDVYRYGAEFDDSLKVNDLFDVLETYAQAYLAVYGSMGTLSGKETSAFSRNFLYSGRNAVGGDGRSKQF